MAYVNRFFFKTQNIAGAPVRESNVNMKKATLVKRIPVSAVDFGKNDAKHDAIEKYFYDTGIANDIERGNTSVVIGRKGTGKTALAYHVKNLSEASANKFASILSFKDIPVALMDQFVDKEHAASNKYVLLELCFSC